MQNVVWTFFHRSGRYTEGYEILWERYLCYGGTVDGTWEADSAGSRKDRLTLYLPTYGIRLLDDDGQSVTLAETGIGPGDLLALGDVTVPGRNCYRIASVTRQAGVGLTDDHVLVAE